MTPDDEITYGLIPTFVPHLIFLFHFIYFIF